MKLIELFEEKEDLNITPADMEIVFNALKDRGELDVSEVGPLAKELVDEYQGYSRNEGSARFVIQRMHVILHGMAPTGVSEQTASTWMQPARPLINFMAEKGYNADDAIAMAREEAASRLVKRKEGEAKEIMVAYYRQNRAAYTPQQDKAIRAQKDQIVQALKAGQKVEDVFTQATG